MTLNADGTLTYEQDTLLQIPDRAELFHHTDENTLRKVGEAPTQPAPALRRAERGLGLDVFRWTSFT